MELGADALEAAGVDGSIASTTQICFRRTCPRSRSEATSICASRYTVLTGYAVHGGLEPDEQDDRKDNQNAIGALAAPFFDLSSDRRKQCGPSDEPVRRHGRVRHADRDSEPFDDCLATSIHADQSAPNSQLRTSAAGTTPTLPKPARPRSIICARTCERRGSPGGHREC